MPKGVDYICWTAFEIGEGLQHIAPGLFRIASCWPEASVAEGCSCQYAARASSAVEQLAQVKAQQCANFCGSAAVIGVITETHTDCFHGMHNKEIQQMQFVPNVSAGYVCRGRPRSICGVACPVCGSGDPNHTHTSSAFNQPSQKSLDTVGKLCCCKL